MPIEIHSKQRERILAGLSRALPSVSIRHGKFMAPNSFRELAPAALAYKPSKQVKAQFGEWPLLDFVVGYLRQRLRDFAYEADEGPRALGSYPGMEDSEALANDILTQFESLPWTYTLSVAMPINPSSVLLALPRSVSLSGDCRILKPDDPLLQSISLDAGTRERNNEIHARTLLSYFEDAPTWQPDRAVFQCQVEGFIPIYGGSAIAEVTDSLKSFCGLGLALGMFVVTPSFERLAPTSCWYVHRWKDGAWHIEQRIDVPEEIAKALSLLNPGGRLDSEKVREWNFIQGAGIGIAFEGGERARNVLLAGRWLFDGYTGHDDMLNFVQCMIVLETLLGDGGNYGEASLSAIISSRLAYSIAESREERSALEKEFRDLYALRGKIVHRGHSRFNDGETHHLNRLRQLCARVVRHEIRLLFRRAEQHPPAGR